MFAPAIIVDFLNPYFTVKSNDSLRIALAWFPSSFQKIH